MKKLSVLELNRVSKEDYKGVKKLPLVIVLDNIRSLNNVGSVFRTADAFTIAKIYLCGVTSTPPHPDIHKTALGAEDSVEWEYCESTIDVVEKLRNESFKIYAIEQCDGSFMLDKFEVSTDSKYAIVLGNEVKGVNQAVVDICDGAIEIPQFGTKHSLNVSIAAGIVMWDMFVKLR